MSEVDPKKAAGDLKCPLNLIPPISEEECAWVLALGATKYGPWNWRELGISFSTYQAAIKRHVNAIARGEWLDPESGKPHFAHIMASCAIVLDANEHGKFTYDHPPK